MKLTPIFSIIVAIHALAIAFLFIFPGCQSSPRNNSANTKPKLSYEAGTNAQQITQPKSNYIEPAPAQKYGRRYPPSRPNWNVSSNSEPDVIEGYNAYTEHETAANAILKDKNLNNRNGPKYCSKSAR